MSVIGTAEPWALPVVEAIPRDRDFYDFEARYTPGMTDFEAPARLPDAVAEEAAALALRCFRRAGLPRPGPGSTCCWTPTTGLWVLEVNSIPGMTDTSLLPKAAEAAGLGFDEVVERILADAALGA